MKNYNFIKLIYSYLILFLTCATIFFNLIWVTKGYLEIKYDLYSIPYDLKSEFYASRDQNKKLSADQIEKNRQQEIENNKKYRLQEIKKDIFTSYLPTLFYAVIIMLIHILIVVRTKKMLNSNAG